MTLEISNAYFEDSYQYGWEITNKGLQAYERQVKAGLRERWSEKKTNNVQATINLCAL